MSPIFSQQFRVRFDECGLDSGARASACLRYVVEIAFAHSAHAGFPLAWYDSRKLHWLVRRVRLDLHQVIPYGSLLTVTTEVVGFRRIWARRHSTIQDSGGKPLGDVTLDWIFTDGRGTPTRVVPEMVAAFPVHAERARLEVEHLEVGTPPQSVQLQRYLVPAHQVDPRGHMNNAAYIELFEDGLAELGTNPQQRPVTYEVEYLKPVGPGEVLHRYIWGDLDRWNLLGVTSAGSPVVRARRVGSRDQNSKE
jgi:acyl-ACP thioesterase